MAHTHTPKHHKMVHSVLFGLDTALTYLLVPSNHIFFYRNQSMFWLSSYTVRMHCSECVWLFSLEFIAFNLITPLSWHLLHTQTHITLQHIDCGSVPVSVQGNNKTRCELQLLCGTRARLHTPERYGHWLWGGQSKRVSLGMYAALRAGECIGHNV